MKFNGYKYLILSVAAAFSFSSCLDEDPLYTQNNEIVFSSASNAELALMGCYSYFASTSTYGQNMQEVLIGVAGHSWSQRNAADPDLFVSLNLSASMGQVGPMWDGLYKVISESNAFIENMQNSGLDEATVTQYVGEAKFLRAVAYYNLVALFGDVPLKTVASTSEGLNMPRVPREEIFTQIIKDLTDALAINEEAPANERACRWTVKAYLGKVYHKMAALGIDAQQNWKNAQTYFDDVYEHGPYRLESNFADLFGDWVTGSSEAIFQINFIPDPASGYYNRGGNRLCPQGSTTGINFYTFSFSFSAYDLHWGTYPGDPRIRTTFLTQWRNYKSNNQANPQPQVGAVPSPNDSVYTYPYITYTVPDVYVLDANGDPVMNNNKPVLQKFVTRIPYEEMADAKNPSLDQLANMGIPANATPQEKARIEALQKVSKTFTEKASGTVRPYFGKAYDQFQAAQATHKNLMVYRYAEMLLLMADVYNELDNTSRAVQLANEVLARARNSAGDTPAAQPANWDENLDQNTVREKLYFERIFELWGEPTIWDMTRLRGTELMNKYLEYHNRHELVKASDAYYQESNSQWAERVYNNGNLTPDFLQKNLLFPIPTSEIDANPAIKENNFGY